jgi:Methylamine utilisation protein MauE
VTWVNDISLACRFLMGTVFTVSVVAKLHGKEAWRSFASWLSGLPFRPLGLRWAPAALTAAEAAVAVLVALSATAPAGLMAASALCLALTAGLAVAVRRGSRQPCHCFGSSSEPLSAQDVGRNALLLALAVTGLACAAAGGTGSVGPAEVGLTAVGGVAAAVIIIFFGDVAALLVRSAWLRGGS